MPAVTNSTGVDFVFNNLQIYDAFNTASLIPNVIQMEQQSALQMTGRLPGGSAYRGNSAVVAPATNSAMVLLDGMVTLASNLGYAKNGAFIVSLNGTNAAVVPLTNTATNTNSVAGDTVFTQWKQITMYNLSGLDNHNSAVMYVEGSGVTNGVNLAANTNSILALAGSSRIVLESVNGITVNAANANVSITPTADSTFGMVISGS